MPIVAADIKFRLSGGASNSDPLLSLGGAMSSTEMPAGGPFGNVGGLQANASGASYEYRCIYVYNSHATLTLTSAVFWIVTQLPVGGEVSIGKGQEGLNGTAETVANRFTAPVGETIAPVYTSYAGGLSLGNIPPGGYYPLWIKRGASSTPGSYTFTLRVEGDTV